MGLGTTLKITLPIPDIRISPNGKCHWSVKAKLVKRHRSNALLTTLEALQGRTPPTPVAYTFAYYWPSTRRDDDNAIASGKPYMDGICQAMRVDDKALRFRELFHHSDRAKPRMEITLHLASASP
jgi:hypothetical protein